MAMCEINIRDEFIDKVSKIKETLYLHPFEWFGMRFGDKDGWNLHFFITFPLVH